MNKKRVLIAGTVLVVASAPLFTSWMPLSTLSPSPVFVYPGNHGFLHQVGVTHPYGWEAHFRSHRPGYLVQGLRNGGENLPPGTYQYAFYFALRPGQLSSLISGANDVVRLEAADVTTREILNDRVLQRTDFRGSQKKLIVKHIRFSTVGRISHRFEPRVYWQGLTGIFLQRVELVSLGVPSPIDLQQKATDFEAIMKTHFLDRGFVVVRDERDRAEDTNDAAIWTGLYAATEAMRYKTNQDVDARRRMEQSLWALHSLVKESPIPGSLIRFIAPDGKIVPHAASKDTYTGFFYGVAQAMPYVHDPALRTALLADLQALGNHFLDQNLSFRSPDGYDLDFNPYPGPGFMKEASQDLRSKASLRRDLTKTLRFARWYFLLHGQRPPPDFARMIRKLKHPETLRLENEIVPFLNDLLSALKKLQRNVHRSALRGPREGLNDTPYLKLDLLLLRALANMEFNTQGRPIASIEDFKILPSQSLHALHFLKVAGEQLPKPNRFDDYYYANLYEGKALLRTAIQWHQIDEEAVTAVLGQTESDTRRTSSSHLSYLALHDLIELEKDPITRFKYQKLFEAQFQPMRSDGNAMIDAMHAAVGLSPKQLGLAWWSLESYPVDRRGKGDRYWRENRRTLIAAFGGEVNRQAREPLPPGLRPRDAFLWQRSAHSIRGDMEGWLYPPLDYLFAYWLAKTSKDASLAAVSEKF